MAAIVEKPSSSGSVTTKASYLYAVHVASATSNTLTTGVLEENGGAAICTLKSVDTGNNSASIYFPGGVSVPGIYYEKTGSGSSTFVYEEKEQ